MTIILFSRRTGRARPDPVKAAHGKSSGTIVAVGGDGTVNDVLNGLSNFENITFGYIPSGSGKTQPGRGLHLETDPEKALERILSPPGQNRFGSVSCLRPGFFPAFSREQRSGLLTPQSARALSISLDLRNF